VQNEKKLLNKISFRLEEKKDGDIKNESLISSPSIEDETLNNLKKIKKIKLDEKDDLYSKVKFSRPSSILTPVLKLIQDNKVQEKLQKMRENFNLNKYLKKEKEEGLNTDFLGRRKSYLDFLQYTEKQQDIKTYLKEGQKNEKKKSKKSLMINNDINNISLLSGKSNNSDMEKKSKQSKLEDLIEDKHKDEISFLSSDSNLSLDKNNISLGDINLLPKDLKEMTIFVNNTTTKETIKKNMRLNKLTQLLRNSNFDKNAAVNTNINLTYTEQSNYYKKVNKNLNKNLFVDLTNPRNRKSNKLNISTIRSERDYNDFLENHIGNDDNLSENDESKSENNDEQLIENDNLESERNNLKAMK
jgi:hypothetical protein